MTTIKLKNGSGAPTAGDLAQGEPALDLTNKRLYTEDSLGAVIEVGTNPTSVTTGTITGSGDLAINTDTLFVDVSADAVGIGTSSPSNPLEVAGGSSYPTTKFSRDGGTAATQGYLTTGFSAIGYSGGTGADTYMVSEHGFGFAVNAGTTAMTITDGGNVGIGTTSPAAALDISQANARGAYLRSSTTGSRLHFLDSTTAAVTTVGIGAEGNDMVLIGGGSELMRLDSSGNVGIGTSSPDANLEVIGNYKQKALDGNSQGFNLTINSSTDVVDLTNYYNAAMTFGTNNTERMRIDSSGNVGIGTSSPSHTLQAVDTSAGATTYAVVTDNSGASGTTVAGFGFANAGALKSSITAAVYGNDYMTFNVGGSGTTERMRIDSSGNLLVGTQTSRGTRATIEGVSALVTAEGVLDINSTDALGADLGATVSLGGVSTSGGAKSRYAVIGGRKENATDGNYAGYFQIATTNGSGTTSEAMRIDSSGTAIFKGGTQDNAIQIWESGSEIARIGPASGALRFLVGSTTTPRMVIDSSGNLLVGRTGHSGYGVANFEGGIDVTTNPIYARGGGIYIGGVASANLLDDYEEGTFTPTVASGVTSPAYSAVSGSYTKIGNLVYFQFRLDLSSGTANSSHFKFGGLPFTSENTANYGGAWISYSAGFIDDLGAVSLHIPASSTTVSLYKPADGAVMSGIEVEAAGNVLSNVYVNGVYKV